MVGHGSRHTASTLLREHGWQKDHVEMQLSHLEEGTVGDYNHSRYLLQRRAMIQWYADYLDALKAGTATLKSTSGTSYRALPTDTERLPLACANLAAASGGPMVAV